MVDELDELENELMLSDEIVLVWLYDDDEVEELYAQYDLIDEIAVYNEMETRLYLYVDDEGDEEVDYHKMIDIEVVDEVEDELDGGLTNLDILSDECENYEHMDEWLFELAQYVNEQDDEDEHLEDDNLQH